MALRNEYDAHYNNENNYEASVGEKTYSSKNKQSFDNSNVIRHHFNRDSTIEKINNGNLSQSMGMQQTSQHFHEPDGRRVLNEEEINIQMTRSPSPTLPQQKNGSIKGIYLEK